jgi:hypothetical protein
MEVTVRSFPFPRRKIRGMSEIEETISDRPVLQEKTAVPKLLRQGDVLLKLVPRLPRGSKKVGDNVLARGETTGHSHRMMGGEVYRTPSNQTLVLVRDEASLVHEEHKQIEVPKGIYRVIQQREYDPRAEQRRRFVLD